MNDHTKGRVEQIYVAVAVIKEKCSNDEAVQYGWAAFFILRP
jgi:hypothetical protein